MPDQTPPTTPPGETPATRPVAGADGPPRYVALRPMPAPGRHGASRIGRAVARVAILGMAAAGALPAGAEGHASTSGFYTPIDGPCCSRSFLGTVITEAAPFATSSFNGPPAGATASAMSTVGAKHALASFLSTSADTSGVSPSEFRNLTGAYGDTSVNFGQEPPRELVAVASESTILHPSTTSLARFRVYYNRSLSADLVPNVAAIKSYVQGFAAAYGVTDPDTPLFIRAGSFEVQSNLNVRFIDQSAPANRLLYTVYSAVQSSYFVETSLSRIAQDSFGITTEQRAVTGTRISIQDAGLPSVDEELVTQLPFGPLASSSSYITQQPLFLRQGRQYQFDFGLDCLVQIHGAARFFEGSTAACDASRSAYWGGLASVTNELGQPVTAPDLLGENGFNYRLASPQAPVPEPSTWAMLLAGLAIGGWRIRPLRRRRG